MSKQAKPAELQIGDKKTKTHRFTQSEFDSFAHISGDDNPIHVDPVFSARTRFGKTVSHGMLLYSHLWGMIQTWHPGARQLSQDIKFPAPTFTEEEVVFEIEILDISVNGDLHLKTQARSPDRGTKGLEGTCVIRLQDKEAVDA